MRHHLLLFTQPRIDTGFELWCSDGTDAGTHMVADISMTSDASNLMAIGSGVVLSTSERTCGNELFVSDGAGSAFAAAPIPNDPGFLGLSLFAQWLVAAPGGPLLGLGVASEAMHVVVGG